MRAAERTDNGRRCDVFDAGGRRHLAGALPGHPCPAVSGPAPRAVSHARAPAPPGARRAGGRVLHPRRVEGRPPALPVVPRELKVVALACHADSDMTDTGPTVEPGA